MKWLFSSPPFFPPKWPAATVRARVVGPVAGSPTHAVMQLQTHYSAPPISQPPADERDRFAVLAMHSLMQTMWWPPERNFPAAGTRRRRRPTRRRGGEEGRDESGRARAAGHYGWTSPPNTILRCGLLFRRYDEKDRRPAAASHANYAKRSAESNCVESLRRSNNNYNETSS